MEPPRAFDEATDATRRTRLASERTYLAWWRSGLASLAVALGAGRLVPELAGGANWPYEVLGLLYAVIGIAFIVYAYIRQRDVEAALARREFAPFPSRVALGFAVLGVVLGVVTALVLIVHPG
jgi:putative membrane protein